jgi:spore germination protein GerM
MGQWKTVFEGEVEGRPVMVKVYESEDDQDGAADPAVRVVTTPIGSVEGALQTLFTGPAAEGRLITLDPAIFDDLEEELVEVGFSPEAAAGIIETVPREPS